MSRRSRYLFAALMISSALLPLGPGALAGQEAPDSKADLQDFRGFFGQWVGDPAPPPDSPRAAFLDFRYEWGPNQGTVEFTQGVHRTDATKDVVPGFIYWHPSQRQIRYSAYNTRADLYFDGYFESLSPDAYSLRYTVHYADGVLKPSADFDSDATREYREVHRLVGTDVLEAMTFVRTNEGWRRFPDATATGPRTLRRVRP